MTGMLKSFAPKATQAPTQTQTTGMVKSAPPSPPQAPSIAVFGARRREAMDALVAHEGLLGDRERLIATMGPEGYAQAVAAAAEKAEQATAAYRAVWGALSV